MPVNTKQKKGNGYGVKHHKSLFLQIYLEAARDDSAGQHYTRHYVYTRLLHRIQICALLSMGSQAHKPHIWTTHGPACNC